MTEATQTKPEKLTLAGINARVNSIDDALVQILQIVQQGAAATKAIAPAVTVAKTEDEVKKDKEIDEASAIYESVNPHWVAIAKKTLGSALDHCEVFYPKNGGTIFTVVVHKDHSNAPAEYLKMMGSDRRSKDVAAEGVQGVEGWCKLIAQNLKRNQPVK